jgi:hypothetical protein
LRCQTVARPLDVFVCKAEADHCADTATGSRRLQQSHSSLVTVTVSSTNRCLLVVGSEEPRTLGGVELTACELANQICPLRLAGPQKDVAVGAWLSLMSRSECGRLCPRR